jgi:hypothetical protein
MCLRIPVFYIDPIESVWEFDIENRIVYSSIWIGISISYIFPEGMIPKRHPKDTCFFYSAYSEISGSFLEAVCAKFKLTNNPSGGMQLVLNWTACRKIHKRIVRSGPGRYIK